MDTHSWFSIPSLSLFFSRENPGSTTRTAPASKVMLTLVTLGLFMAQSCQAPQENPRKIVDFNDEWSFHLGDVNGAEDSAFDHSAWRVLDVPHDWSIEGEFSPDHPATTGGGALPGGIGWYRKTFTPPVDFTGKIATIQFDGIYMNSEVWINGHFLGRRPFGYISFEYDLTPYLKYGEPNTLAVKVNNAPQPNSRWYSGSGIYRNVRIVYAAPTHIPNWGTYVWTTDVSSEKALINVETKIVNPSDKPLKLKATLIDPRGEVVQTTLTAIRSDQEIITQQLDVLQPALWSPSSPDLYQVISEIIREDKVIDRYVTTMGIRYFHFDVERGFIFNGKPLKIKGVCQHHDLGALGAAVNERALERQIELLKGMGVNAIRTAHNPPAPTFLELCDRMGILVMNETFDIWSMKKSPHDYALYWNDWHERDLTDHILRDRNHPSVIMWSIGNEILDQWSEPGTTYAKKLAKIVKTLDPTCPITAGMNPPNQDNTIATSGALDVIGYNYHHPLYTQHQAVFENLPFIATETNSALATRGYYDSKSDTLLRWPIRWDLPFVEGNPDNTVSAYDQVSTPWGSTHHELLPLMMKHDYLSGMFIWTGFDYLGEPTPYTWPSRSSYFGVIDLAGFPKDSYYLYKSYWADEDVLHIFPHWNLPAGRSPQDSVDVWAYFNTEEVELFINGISQGTRSKANEEVYVMWKVPYEPGELKAIARSQGKVVLEKIIHTTGEGKQIQLTSDRSDIVADGRDLSFITVEIVDEEGRSVPTADNLINFQLEGPGTIVGVDNGDPTSHLSLKGTTMRLFNGKCLVIVKSQLQHGTMSLTATSSGLIPQKISINSIEKTK